MLCGAEMLADGLCVGRVWVAWGMTFGCCGSVGREQKKERVKRFASGIVGGGMLCSCSTVPIPTRMAGLDAFCLDRDKRIVQMEAFHLSAND